jgi:hypothetical protein
VVGSYEYGSEHLCFIKEKEDFLIIRVIFASKEVLCYI